MSKPTAETAYRLSASGLPEKAYLDAENAAIIKAATFVTVCGAGALADFEARFTLLSITQIQA